MRGSPRNLNLQLSRDILGESMAKIFGLDIPSGLEDLFRAVLQLKPNGDVEGIGLTLPKTTYRKNQGLRNRSLFVSLESYWDAFDSTHKTAWTEYWETLPFGPHSGDNGWPGSGYSAYVYANAPRIKEGLDLLEWPPGYEPPPVYVPLTWDRYVDSRNFQYRSIKWSPALGIFCSGGINNFPNNAATSSDGINWSFHGTIANTNGPNVEWAPSLGYFLALAPANGTHGHYTSPDGVTWTDQGVTPTGFWMDVTWSEELGIFVAVGSPSLPNQIMTSPDGITWTQRTTPAAYWWTEVLWVKELGLFVAVAGNSSPGAVMYSSNGTSWTLATGIPNLNWFALCWSRQLGLLVAVAHNANSGNVMTSPDGINWTQRTTPGTVVCTDVAWGYELGQFVAVGDNATNSQLMYSPDGLTWTVVNIGANTAKFSIEYSPALELFTVGTTAGANVSRWVGHA